jgi:hypothetical protein
VYHLKLNPTITLGGTKMKSEAGSPRVIDLPDLSRDTGVMVTPVIGRCSRQLCKSCAVANVVYSRAERVFILEQYFEL